MPHKSELSDIKYNFYLSDGGGRDGFIRHVSEHQTPYNYVPKAPECACCSLFSLSLFAVLVSHTHPCHPRAIGPNDTSNTVREPPLPRSQCQERARPAWPPTLLET